MIKAETHTDDRVYQINFDATPWFEHAASDVILELHDCGWGGSSRAPKRVVEWFYKIGLEPEIQAMGNYIQQRAGTPHQTDYACFVSGQDAVVWLDQNRPNWRHACRRCGSTMIGGVRCPNNCFDASAKGRYAQPAQHQVGCECGAYATSGAGKGNPAHYDWCPWSPRNGA